MGRRFIAERLVSGDEITVPVLGNSGDELQALPPVGIYPSGGADYFTYEAKYQPQKCEEIVPPRGMDSEDIGQVQELAMRCHRSLQCDGLSRTDMIMGDDGPVVMADCSSIDRLRAFITSGSKGSVSIAVPGEPGWVDTNPSEPGYTPLYVGGLPQQVFQGGVIAGV